MAGDRWGARRAASDAARSGRRLRSAEAVIIRELGVSREFDAVEEITRRAGFLAGELVRAGACGYRQHQGAPAEVARGTRQDPRSDHLLLPPDRTPAAAARLAARPGTP